MSNRNKGDLGRMIWTNLERIMPQSVIFLLLLICCFVVREDHGSVFLFFVFLAILCKFGSFLNNNFIFHLKQFEWILLSSAKKTVKSIQIALNGK